MPDPNDITPPQPVTQPVAQPAAKLDAMFESVMAELRVLAGQMMGGERGSHTLQPTALVNEAFVRLCRKGGDLAPECGLCGGLLKSATISFGQSMPVLAMQAAVEACQNCALAKGRLSPVLREEIALAIAEANACDYCLSAHSYVAEGLGLDVDERTRARHFQSDDARRAAGLTFAFEVYEQRGHVSDAALTAVHGAGFDDGEVLEIVAVVAINILTNYLNDVARVDVDFPRVHAGELARAA